VSDDRKAPSPRGQADVQQDLEYAMLGSLLFRPSFYAEVAGKLKPEYFSKTIYQRVFIEFERRHEAGLSTTLPSLLGSFDDELIDDKERLHAHLKESYKVADSGISARQIDELRLRYTVSSLQEAGKLLTNFGPNLVSPDLAIQQFFDSVDELRFGLQQTHNVAEIMPIGEAADIFAADLADRIDGKVEEQRVTTGFHALDNLIGGFAEGELIILAGRPGMGKTTLATAIVRAAAYERAETQDLEGHVLTMAKPAYPSLVFSLEMPRRQIMGRMLADDIANHASTLTSPHIEYRTLINPRSLSRQEWLRLHADGKSILAHVHEAQRRLRGLPIELDCSSKLTIGEIAARVRKAKITFAKNGKKLALVVIDYLKFIQASARYIGNKVLEVGEITGALKNLAKELMVPIILLCQLNRSVEKRKGDDKEPILADLRDSGEIEQDADVVMFVYRKSYYEPSASGIKNDLSVLVEKNRNGPTGRVELYIDLGRSYIRNV